LQASINRILVPSIVLLFAFISLMKKALWCKEGGTEVKAAQDVRKSNSVDETIEELRNCLHLHVCSGALEAQLFFGLGLKNEMEASISLYKKADGAGTMCT